MLHFSTLSSSKIVLFAYFSCSSAPPRAEGDLHPIPTIPKPGNAAETLERDGAESSPVSSDTITFSRLFLPVSHRKIRSSHSAASPSRHRGLLSMGTDSSSIFLTLSISSILGWGLYPFQKLEQPTLQRSQENFPVQIPAGPNSWSCLSICKTIPAVVCNGNNTNISDLRGIWETIWLCGVSGAAGWKEVRRGSLEKAPKC